LYQDAQQNQESHQSEFHWILLKLQRVCFELFSMLAEGGSAQVLGPIFRIPQLAGIVPQIRFLGHGEHLKTFYILDEPVTARINWLCRIGVKSM
jgi:hypothetical protein